MCLVAKGYFGSFSGLCLMGLLLVSGSASGDLRVYRENMVTPEKVEFFKEELTTCREGLESRSGNQKIPGYACPRKVPKLYSRALKYQPGKNKCWHNGKRVPFPAFCHGEVLQLRLELGESFHGNVSSETAIEVNWGTASEAPFFCPKSFSNLTSAVHQDSYDYCLSHACKQKMPFRSGDTERTFGQFYQVNNTWVLNLTLRENPGKRTLAFRVFSCAVGDCRLWKPAGQGKVNDCCHIGNSFDLTIYDFERNQVDRPAKRIGNGQYNVTLHKNDAFYEITVVDVVRGETVKNISTADGKQKLLFTLNQGVYQVTGKTHKGCRAGELSRPVVLEPRNATYGPVEFVDFFSRVVRWSLSSDLPVERFDFYSRNNVLNITHISRHHMDHRFELDGNRNLDDHAPLNQTFVHRVVYQGVNDTESSSEVFDVDLSDFLPLSIAVAHNSSHAFAQWTVPDAYPEYVVAYKLWVDDSKGHFVQMFDEKEVGKVGEFAYRPRDLFVPDEVIIIGVGAVYQNNTIFDSMARWYGPINYATIVIPHSSAQFLSTVASGSTLTGSHTPSTAGPTSGHFGVGPLGVIAGASAVGGIAVGMFIAAFVTALICKSRAKSHKRLLDNLVADSVLDE